MSSPLSGDHGPAVEDLRGEHAAPPQKGRQGLRRLLNALAYSWAGLRAAWRREAAFREEVLLVALCAPAALVLGSLMLVLIVELLNSAIETVVDRVSAQPHPLSKIAKDIGSAAVLFALVNAAVVWSLVLWS
jgi:diacylglycerol kinase (ATP)